MSQITIARQPYNAARVIIPFITVAALSAIPTNASAQLPQSEPRAAFASATTDYARMHRRLERRFGSIEIGSSVESINRTIHQLGDAIRVERADARQGDFFTPALAREIRVRIDETLRAGGFTAADVRSASRVDGVDYTAVRLRVNDTFPWVLGTAMFPCVIAALPPLPPELQYRIVDADLVLIDVHASLIIDVLPAAVIDEDPIW